MILSVEQSVALLLVLVPALVVLVAGSALWLRQRSTERLTALLVEWAAGAVVLLAAGLWVELVVRRAGGVKLPTWSWFSVGHYSFAWTLLVDRLSLPVSALFSMLIAVVAAFSSRYLHREEGYFRFFFLLALFSAGTQLVLLAGTLDVLFMGWELVGISSALLIAFYHERAAPVAHGLRAFMTYRMCDVGLLAAVVWLHHTEGTSAMTGTSSIGWSGLAVPSDPGDALLVALLLIWGAMGKAALFPLGGWLPRAMEGPTTSSAIFYGAVSVHLGPFLLLRSAPVLEQAPVALVVLGTIGALTALHGTLVGRAQTDVKTALAYASMTQVGLIVLEISCGFYRLALAHLIGHACFRSLQILRSPNLLHDRHHLEQALGSRLPITGSHYARWVPRGVQSWLYRSALERGHTESMLRVYCLEPIVKLFQWLDARERSWIAFLTGDTGAEAKRR